MGACPRWIVSIFPFSSWLVLRLPTPSAFFARRVLGGFGSPGKAFPIVSFCVMCFLLDVFLRSAPSHELSPIIFLRVRNRTWDPKIVKVSLTFPSSSLFHYFCSGRAFFLRTICDNLHCRVGDVWHLRLSWAFSMRLSSMHDFQEAGPGAACW